MITVGTLLILYGLLLLVSFVYIGGAIVIGCALCYFANILVDFLVEKMRNLRHGHKNSV
jgi:hypothetical protein